MKVAKVEWVDSTSYDGWRSRNLEFSPVNIETVGYLFNVNKEGVTIVQSEAPVENGINAMIVIPKGCITKVSTLSKNGKWTRRKV